MKEVFFRRRNFLYYFWILIRNFALFPGKNWGPISKTTFYEIRESLLVKKLFEEKWYVVFGFWVYVGDYAINFRQVCYNGIWSVQRHILKKLLYLVYLFFFGLRTMFFSEVWQKISGRLMKTVFHVYRGNFAGNCFSYLKSFFFYFCFRIWEKKFWELWQKLMAGSSNLFFQLSRENICRKFFTKLFWVFEKSSEIDQKFPWNFATWQKTSANLAKLHFTCPEEVFEAVFLEKNNC